MRPVVRHAIIALTIVGVTVLAAVVFWFWLLETQQRDVDVSRARAELRTSQLSAAAAQEFDAELRSIDIALLHLRRVYRDDPMNFKHAVADVLESYPKGMLQFVTTFDGEGDLAFSSGPVQGRPNIADREHFKVPAQSEDDELFIGEVVIGRLSGVPVIQVTRAIREGGRFLGVIGVAVRPEYLSSQLAALQVDPTDVLSIVRLDGSFIARSHGLQEAIKTKVPKDRPFMSAKPGEQGLFRSSSTVDKVPLVFSWRRLADWPISVVAAVDEEKELGALAQQQARERRNALLALALLVVFASGIAAFVVHLGQKNDALARSEARHRALFAGSKTPMMLIDPDGGAIVDANHAAEVFYGYGRERLMRMRISDINTLSREQIAAEMELARAERRDCFFFPHRLASGEIRQVEVHSGPLEIGGRALLYSVIHDITDRRVAEAKVASETARLAALLETASDGIHILDEEGRLQQFSHSFATMLGYTESEMQGMDVSQWDAQIPPEELIPTVRELIRSPRRFETCHRRKDGSVFDVEINAKGIEIEGRRYLYASSRDITERKLAEQQVRVAAAAFESQEGMLVTDADAHILRVNQAFTDITGYSAQEAVGRRPSILKSGRHDRAFYAAMWAGILSDGQWKGEIWNRRKNGQEFIQWLTVTAVKDEAGRISHFVGTLTDITMRKAAEEEVKSLAFYDPLTHLPNRRLMMDRLKHALASSGRSKRTGAVCFIDIDHFKTLNDTRGHEVGDRFLQQVAVRLSACLRDSDTVARFGGDEFVVLLSDLSPVFLEAAAQAETVGGKILSALRLPFELEGQALESSASIGVTLFGEKATTVEEVLKQADMAMYQAKAAGRDGMRFFDPEMQSAIIARTTLEADLRRGLQRGELRLFYQSQADRSGRPVGAEALLRWQHPERGLTSPADFIALAEDSGLIVPVGQWVLETACAQLVAWAREPLTSKLTLSVNVSARQFHEDDFVDQVLAALERTGADARKLKLELTESALLADVEAVIAKMAALKGRGVCFSLDDFGTGYSSLSRLKLLPLDQLKIDRGFVRDILVDPNDAAIARMVIALADSMGLSVIAEGVETEAQRDFLAGLGCFNYQGFLFSRPVPIAAFEDFVRAAWAEVGS